MRRDPVRPTQTEKQEAAGPALLEQAIEATDQAVSRCQSIEPPTVEPMPAAELTDVPSTADHDRAVKSLGSGKRDLGPVHQVSEQVAGLGFASGR